MLRILGVLLLCAAGARAESPVRDLSRPECREKYDGVVIEWISQAPAVPVRKVGDRSAPAEGGDLAYTAHLRNLSSKASGPVLVRWLVDGTVVKTETHAGMAAGKSAELALAWTAEDGRHWIQCDLVGQGEWLTIASDALTVRVLVEKKTLSSHEPGTGSFARRLQDSFARLHASWSAVRQSPWAVQGVEERFRIDSVSVYERGDGAGQELPAEFRDHPGCDLLLVCDAGGPAVAPEVASGSIFLAPAAAGPAPLLSPAGERALWHLCGRSRGLPDFSEFETRPGEVALRHPSGDFIEPLRLRPEFSRDVMYGPGSEANWGEYAAVAIQMKRGVARLGRPDDPQNTFGHLWRHVPSRIEVQVIDRDGKPVRDAGVSLFRPVRGGEGNRPRVEADAEPVARGTTGEDGVFPLGDDPFGRRRPETGRAPWVLVAMSRNGVVRYGYITLLEMNLRYWRDEKESARVPVAWIE